MLCRKHAKYHRRVSEAYGISALPDLNGMGSTLISLLVSIQVRPLDNLPTDYAILLRVVSSPQPSFIVAAFMM